MYIGYTNGFMAQEALYIMYIGYTNSFMAQEARGPHIITIVPIFQNAHQREGQMFQLTWETIDYAYRVWSLQERLSSSSETDNCMVHFVKST